MAEYNGWTNYETWNVVLWLENEERTYLAICNFMKDYKGKQPYVDFCESSGLDAQSNGDGVRWVNEKLNYEELNNWMWEFSPQGTRS